MSKIEQYDLIKVSDNPSPNDVVGNTLYYVERGINRWVYFRCPCGCQELIILNVGSKFAPHCWQLVFDTEGKPTVSPSIRRTDNCACKSHFFIRNGKVVWA